MEEDIDRAIKNIEKDIELSKEGEGFYTEVLCNKEDLENLLTRCKQQKERIRCLELKIVNQKENIKLLEKHRLKKYVMSEYIEKSELKKDLKHMKNVKATGVKQLLMKKGIIGYLEKLLERSREDV